MADPTSPQDRLAGLSREQRALLFEQVRRRKEKERAAAPPAGIPRRPPGLEPLPLSFAQERLWFIDRMQPGLTAYNMPLALRVSRGDLAGRLRGAARRGGAPARGAAHDLPGGRRPAGPGDRARRPLDPAARRPLGPARRAPRRPGEGAWPRRSRTGRSTSRAGRSCAPPCCGWRPAEHALLLDMHHIVSDGWSMGVLVREISALYGAARAGAPSPLPELPIQYADFAVWQRGWLRGEVLERQLAYWREQLAGAAGHARPAGGPAAAVRAHPRRRRGSASPSPPVSRRELAAFARRHEATPFMVLLAGFQALLSRLTGAGGPHRRLADRQPQPGGDRAADRLLRQHPGAARRPHGRPVLRELLARVRARPPWRPTPTRTSPSSSWWRSCGRSGIWRSTRSSRSSSPCRTRRSAPWSSPACRSPRWRSRPGGAVRPRAELLGLRRRAAGGPRLQHRAVRRRRPRAGSPRTWRPCCAARWRTPAGRSRRRRCSPPAERQQLVREWNDTGRRRPPARSSRTRSPRGRRS